MGYTRVGYSFRALECEGADTSQEVKGARQALRMVCRLRVVRARRNKRSRAWCFRTNVELYARLILGLIAGCEAHGGSPVLYVVTRQFPNDWPVMSDTLLSHELRSDRRVESSLREYILQLSQHYFAGFRIEQDSFRQWLRPTVSVD